MRWTPTAPMVRNRRKLVSALKPLAAALRDGFQQLGRGGAEATRDLENVLKRDMRCARSTELM